MKLANKVGIASAILPWYGRHARTLPWRALPGQTVDPYRVWLSEIMLQQTTVVTVGPYFKRFMEKWPTVLDLANANLDDILTEWAGLGYYARARNLHKCAQKVVNDFNGVFPDTQELLETLPGIGPYTSAAIASIAFNLPAGVMDGNIERVISRVFRVEQPLPESKSRLYELVKSETPDHRPGDYAQAMMDLGATVCTPGKPKCLLCPVTELCQGKDIAETLPRKKPKKVKPSRYGCVYWIENIKGEILLRRRVETGLLGGMMEFPSTEWREEGAVEAFQDTGLSEMQATAPAFVGKIRHTFTHFHLHLAVYRVTVVDTVLAEDCHWCFPDHFDNIALPTVMRKVAKLALEGGHEFCK